MKYLFYFLFLFLGISCTTSDSKTEKPISTVPNNGYFDQIIGQNGMDVDVFRKGLEIAQQQAKQNKIYRDTEGEWTVQGPGNLGGKVDAIAVDPTDEKIIYIGFGVGGLYKTIDGGNTWNSIFDDNIFTAVYTITIDPSDHNVIYIGTGDLSNSGAFFMGNGLFKSTNGGDSWTHIGLEENGTVTKILVSPTDPNTIYASTMGYVRRKNLNQGVYKTIDGGATWTQSLFVSDTAGVVDMVMDPNDADVVFAAGYNRYYTSYKARLSGLNSKIYRTSDGGNNWTIIEDKLPQFELSRIGLAIYPSNPAKVYAVYTGLDYQVHSIYRSDDAGVHWDSLSTAGLEDATAGFGWYFGEIWVNPTDPDDVFIGGVELWRTKDNGENWTKTTPDWWEYIVHSDMHAMAFTPSGKMILGTDGGLYRSEDDAFSWTDIENIPTNQFYRTYYDPNNPNDYWGGLQDNGTTVGNKNNINNWDRVWGGDGFLMQLNPYNENSGYYSTQRGNIVKLSKAEYINVKEYFIDDRTGWETPYFLSEFDTVNSYYGTYKVYNGRDKGEFNFSVNAISEDLTDGPIPPERYHIISNIAESPIKEGLLYAGTSDGNVWYTNYSVFAPEDWQRIDKFDNDYYVSDIEGSPTDENSIFLCQSSYLKDDFEARVYKTTDMGDTWTSIAGDLPPVNVREILIMPDADDQYIFIANDAGVYVTLNGGEHWERVGTNMPSIPVFDLVYNVVNNQLVAATYGKSLMTYDLGNIKVANEEISSRKKSDKIKLAPNPAADIVTVSFRKIEPTKMATLVVLDLSGKIMLTQEMSSNTTTIDVTGWSTGVYPVKIKERHRVISGQLVVK